MNMIIIAGVARQLLIDMKQIIVTTVGRNLIGIKEKSIKRKEI